MDVLLINPPWVIRKSNIWSEIAGVIPPLGLAQVAAFLERAGVRVRIVDAQAERTGLDSLAGRLKFPDFAPSFVGITATTSIIEQAYQTARISRDVFPGAGIVMGGVHPTVFPEEALSKPFVDYVVRREGESSFLELVNGKPSAEIPGISYRENGRMRHNPDAKEIADINELPFPAYHLLPMDKYHPALGSYKQLPGSGIVTTRGCPGRCTFCFGNYLGNRVRMRSARKIFEEISLLHADYGIREIAFYDDTFTAVRTNVLEFCKLLGDSGLKITWSCFARVDFIDEQLLLTMKKAGCHQICYGVESGCEEILENIKKRISLKKAAEAVRLTKKCGIETRATFMLGNPGDTPQTLEKTLDFALGLDPDIALFNIVTPYPGTEMYGRADKNGYLLTKEWPRYDLSHQIMSLPGLEAGHIEKFYRHAYKRFYARPGYILKRLAMMTNLRTIGAGLKALRAVVGVLFNR